MQHRIWCSIRSILWDRSRSHWWSRLEQAVRADTFRKKPGQSDQRNQMPSHWTRKGCRRQLLSLCRSNWSNTRQKSKVVCQSITNLLFALLKSKFIFATKNTLLVFHRLKYIDKSRRMKRQAYTKECLRFAFNMNGFHTGHLRVYTKAGAGAPRKIPWTMMGDKGIEWKHATVELVSSEAVEVSW